MTKFLDSFLFTTALVAFLTGPLHAAPSDGSRLPPQGRVETGYQYNNMFDRQLRHSYGRISTRDNFFTLSVGLFDWLSLDGKIGLGDLIHKNDPSLPKIEYNTGFAGGYGFRLKLVDYKPWGLVWIAGAQHICVHPQNKNINNNKYESILDDWQISSIVAKRIGIASPYVGIKGSDCEIIYKTNELDRTRRYSRKHVGFILGSDMYFFGDNMRINVEGRFFDETAFTVGISCLL